MPLAHSLEGNKIGDEGASALAAILKETQKITHLKCAAAPIACLSAPADTPVLSLPHPLMHRSLRANYIKVKGVSALAAVLNETKIADLKCAATPECPLSCQRLLTRACSHPSRAVSGTMASETRAPPRSLLSSRRQRSPTSSAPPPQSVRFRVSAP